MTHKYQDKCAKCDNWKLAVKYSNTIDTQRQRIAELEAELHGFRKEMEIK